MSHHTLSSIILVLAVLGAVGIVVRLAKTGGDRIDLTDLYDVFNEADNTSAAGPVESDVGTASPGCQAPMPGMPGGVCGWTSGPCPQHDKPVRLSRAGA